VSDDGTLLVSKKNGAAMIAFPATRAPLTCLAFLPGRKFVATGGADRTLRAWSVADSRMVGSYAVHSDAVTCIDAFGSEQQLVASGDAAGVAVIHTAAPTGAWTTQRTLSTPDSTGLRSLVPNKYRRDQSLLIATDGGLVAEWDLLGKATAAPIWSIKAHTGACAAVVQSPVSRSLVVSAGADKHVVLMSPTE
jgi:WD40 repeat protein